MAPAGGLGEPNSSIVVLEPAWLWSRFVLPRGVRKAEGHVDKKQQETADMMDRNLQKGELCMIMKFNRYIYI